MVEISTPPFSNQNKITEDIALPFLIDISHINGRAIRLNNTISTIIKNHNYPQAISKILAEQLVLTTLLGATLEKNNKVSIQVQSQGVIQLITTDISANGTLRGYALYDKGQLSKTENKFRDLISNAAMIVTAYDTNQKDHHQSIIAIEKNSLSDSFEQYFKQSKQIKVGLKSHIIYNKKSDDWSAGCILLEFLPQNEQDSSQKTKELESEWWERAKAYLETTTKKELASTDLPLKELLYRLFHEDGVRVFAPKVIHNGCTCSREKYLSFLNNTPAEELEQMKINNSISITCEFCSKTETFSYK